MLFRVWNKKNNCWARKPVRIDVDGNIFYQELHAFYAPWYLSDDYDVEFNTGITLADGTETFFGDIIRWKDEHSWTDHHNDSLIYCDDYFYTIISKETFYGLICDWLCEGNVWDDRIELVGNIHETELTDAMKVWIKSR